MGTNKPELSLSEQVALNDALSVLRETRAAPMAETSIEPLEMTGCFKKEKDGSLTVLKWTFNREINQSEQEAVLVGLRNGYCFGYEQA